MQIKNTDYLKYYRVIKLFYRIKHKLTDDKIDMLIFLYSEVYFTKDKCKEYETLMMSRRVFSSLLRDGWINKFRSGIAFKRKTLYCLSIRSKNMVNSFYMKLNGDEIPIDPVNNRLFRRDVDQVNIAYRDMIVKMNYYIKEKRKNKDLNLVGIYD